MEPLLFPSLAEDGTRGGTQETPCAEAARGGRQERTVKEGLNAVPLLEESLLWLAEGEGEGRKLWRESWLVVTEDAAVRVESWEMVEDTLEVVGLPPDSSDMSERSSRACMRGLYYSSA